jgi:hypothetical protein
MTVIIITMPIWIPSTRSCQWPRVEKSALLGTMGNTGDAISTPDHLHFGIELQMPYGLTLSFLKVWESHSIIDKGH